MQIDRQTEQVQTLERKVTDLEKMATDIIKMNQSLKDAVSLAALHQKAREETEDSVLKLMGTLASIDDVPAPLRDIARDMEEKIRKAVQQRKKVSTNTREKDLGV